MKKVFSIALATMLLCGTSTAITEANEPLLFSTLPPEAASTESADMELSFKSNDLPIRPAEYAAVIDITEQQTLNGEITSFGIDESAIWVHGGEAMIRDAQITRTSLEGDGGPSADLFGVGACTLVTDGHMMIDNSTITATANGASGVFALGPGSADLHNDVINTNGSNAGGIRACEGALITADMLTVSTVGEFSPAIDCGSGAIRIDGGTYHTYALNSPVIETAGNILLQGAVLTAANFEALSIKEGGTAQLNNCVLTGSMQDLSQNDCSWTVILYSPSADSSDSDTCTFEMSGGTLNSEADGVFYTTNTKSSILLENTLILANEDCDYFLRCTGNLSQQNWGIPGANGADCVFTALSQAMNGNIIYDTISNLKFRMLQGSILTGAFIDNETYAGEGGNGVCSVSIDASSAWVVTDNSRVTSLECEGIITDIEGYPVTIADPNGDIFTEGSSQFTIITNSYTNVCSSDSSDIKAN